MLFIFMVCVHNTASVGDCEVPLKAGKILQVESKWKTYFARGCSGPPSFPSPLILFFSSLSHIVHFEVPL